MNTNIAVIGCGIWGRNLVRNFYNLGALHTVCDLDADTRTMIEKDYPGVKTVSDINEIFNSKEIHGVIIATPSHTHYNLVKKALLAGKDVYVEKPIATCSIESEELTRIADEKGLVLMVGHLLLYHPAVNRLKTLVEEGVLGNISYVSSDRLNINFFRNDRSVMWDLAPHDVSMISYILGSNPKKVRSANGTATNNDGMFDIVHLDLEYPDNILAHIVTSWIHPVKRVVLIVKGSKATAVLDDAEAVNKLQIFDSSIAGKVSVETPEYVDIEPLKLECQHFINCIINRIKPRSDGENGLAAVQALEEAEKMLLGANYNKIHSLKFSESRKNKVH
ncbi:MAG: Gfo/Idh/MocA family oxidoreductase [bacterium]